MSTIIYLHGYDSKGSKSRKARAIKEHFASDTVLAPDLYEDPKKAIDQIIRLIDLSESETILVGSSLGGLYAGYLNVTTDTPAVLINPLTDVKMIEDIASFGKKEVKYLEKLCDTNKKASGRIAPEYVFLAEDDEVLPYCDTMKNLQETRDDLKVIFSTRSGGHRYKEYESVLNGIENMKELVVGIDFKSLFSEGVTRLAEKFVTALPEDIAMKKELLPVVGPQINKAYAGIGGFLGVPDVTRDSKVLGKIMQNTIWKLVRRDGKIVAGVIYTLKRGRKGICLWTDSTSMGKQSLSNIIREDEKMSRAWIEVSGPAEKFYQRNSGGSPLPREQAEVILDSIGKKAIKWHPDGYHYDREIQGEVHTKCIYGAVK